MVRRPKAVSNHEGHGVYSCLILRDAATRLLRMRASYIHGLSLMVSLPAMGRMLFQQPAIAFSGGKALHRCFLF